MLALLAAVIAIALYWWFAQTQRVEEVALNATVTAVNQATATAEAANVAAAEAQATATASQALAQATSQAQATVAAQQGIDAQVVGGWVDMFGYELPAAEGEAWSRLINDALLAAAKTEPRFIPLASVPLQDGAMAADVVTEAMAKGFGGVMIGTLPKGTGGNLDDPSLEPFWATASKLESWNGSSSM